MTIECIVTLHDIVLAHVADLRSATGREPDWSITTERGSHGGYVCVVLIDNEGAADVGGRSVGEAHRAALVAFRSWRARQPMGLVQADAGALAHTATVVANDLRRIAR